MAILLSQSNNGCQKAAQYFIAVIVVLIVGKLITLIPVMSLLRLADIFTAAEIVWLGAQLSALVLFFYFARASVAAISNSGGLLSFLQNIVEPLTILIIVIIGQALLWQLLDPFVGSTGKTVYFSFAVLAIVALSIFLVFRVYQFAPYLFAASKNIPSVLSRLMSHSSKVCMGCGRYIKNNAVFCSHCGYHVLQAINCSECGREIFADEKFCRYCGSETKTED